MCCATCATNTCEEKTRPLPTQLTSCCSASQCFLHSQPKRSVAAAHLLSTDLLLNYKTLSSLFPPSLPLHRGVPRICDCDHHVRTYASSSSCVTRLWPYRFNTAKAPCRMDGSMGQHVCYKSSSSSPTLICLAAPPLHHVIPRCARFLTKTTDHENTIVHASPT